MTPPTRETTLTPVRCATLRSRAGLEVDIVDYGASIAAIRVPVAGRSVNTVLTYPALEDYRLNRDYLGATVGRYANRIANGRLRIDGSDHELDTHPSHCLHGGPEGFHAQRWTMDVEPARIRCRLVSPHGDQGFPGRVDVRVDYRFVNESALLIDYVATSDRATVVNLANHAYFNLDGDGGSIEEHLLRLKASRFTPSDRDLIPTGEILSVENTEWDFRDPATLRDRLGRHGIDTNFVIDNAAGVMREAAMLRSPKTGIRLSVQTTQPGLQVYTAEQLGLPFAPRAAICLEAQNFPDAPNQAAFPDAVLTAGETYRQRTVYEYSVERA